MVSAVGAMNLHLRWIASQTARGIAIQQLDAAIRARDPVFARLIGPRILLASVLVVLIQCLHGTPLRHLNTTIIAHIGRNVK